MPEPSVLWIALAVTTTVAVLALAAMTALWRAWRRERARLEELQGGQEEALEAARHESVERSRSTLKGKLAEQMAPLLPGFPYQPADARFLGDPIDYVVFRGRSVEDVAEIVLLEVKQGESALSPVQRAIARAVEAGKVRFEVCRVSDGGAVSVGSRPSGRPHSSK
jgi:predicted Holliday junction resolvase-like endonuclease